jgi:hypothetical protein
MCVQQQVSFFSSTRGQKPVTIVWHPREFCCVTFENPEFRYNFVTHLFFLIGIAVGTQQTKEEKTRLIFMVQLGIVCISTIGASYRYCSLERGVDSTVRPVEEWSLTAVELLGQRLAVVAPK